MCPKVESVAGSMPSSLPLLTPMTSVPLELRWSSAAMSGLMPVFQLSLCIPFPQILKCERTALSQRQIRKENKNWVTICEIFWDLILSAPGAEVSSSYYSHLQRLGLIELFSSHRHTHPLSIRMLSPICSHLKI